MLARHQTLPPHRRWPAAQALHAWAVSAGSCLEAGSPTWSPLLVEFEAAARGCTPLAEAWLRALVTGAVPADGAGLALTLRLADARGHRPALEAALRHACRVWMDGSRLRWLGPAPGEACLPQVLLAHLESGDVDGERGIGPATADFLRSFAFNLLKEGAGPGPSPGPEPGGDVADFDAAALQTMSDIGRLLVLRLFKALPQQRQAVLRDIQTCLISQTASLAVAGPGGFACSLLVTVATLQPPAPCAASAPAIRGGRGPTPLACSPQGPAKIRSPRGHAGPCHGQRQARAIGSERDPRSACRSHACSDLPGAAGA